MAWLLKDKNPQRDLTSRRAYLTTSHKQELDHADMMRVREGLCFSLRASKTLMSFSSLVMGLLWGLGEKGF